MEKFFPCPSCRFDGEYQQVPESHAALSVKNTESMLMEMAAPGHEGAGLKQPLGKKQQKCLFSAEGIENTCAVEGLA